MIEKAKRMIKNSARLRNLPVLSFVISELCKVKNQKTCERAIYMEEYIKELLNKISFDRELFLKELKKARRWLTPEESNMLDEWILENHSEVAGNGRNMPVAG